VVEALLEERGGLGDASLDENDRLRIHVLGDPPGKSGRGVGRDLGGLQNDRVAGRDRPDER
jgi:hypothetical protein